MTASPADVAWMSRPSTRVCRVEVWPKPGEADPAADAVLGQARAVFPGVREVHTARIYLIEAAIDDAGLQQVAAGLLVDPVSQVGVLGAAEACDGRRVVEVHYQPGVMDPVAQSTEAAIAEMLPDAHPSVRTGFRYDLVFDDADASADEQALRSFAERSLGNPVIQEIHTRPFSPTEFPHGHAYKFRLVHVPIRDLDDDGLKKLSRDGHLFLSLDEMRAIRDYYRGVEREPTDIELETLAQTWSEHCVHKTLKSTVRYRQQGHGGDAVSFRERPGHEVHEDGSVTIHNLLKSTVAAATFKLMEEDPAFRDWCVSVFVDNAGIVKFDDAFGVCIKVETHNHPSAIEPYGGAATGIGGCIRDVMGTGLSARPIANTNVFAVAPPTHKDLPRGVIPPARTLQQVVAGVRDYGNRMGIPTVNGAVYFHESYLGNPLVFAGCIGLIPLDKCHGNPRPGDRIIALGGATGRDGIHGATFSSNELTDTHADEFSHAVQIGNAITQKKTMDVILRARDAEGGPLFSAITDCGAGGFSSAVGEMGAKIGARVVLENAPLKYRGLTYTEVWISEAQERMVLAVPPEHVDALRGMCDAEDVGFCDLGHFGESGGEGEPSDPQLVLTFHGEEVGRLSMHLLHDGIPMPTRDASWPPPVNPGPRPASRQPGPLADQLVTLLSHPNIASKHWIIRQYDHEVQGGSVIKPLVGPGQDGPSDAAVVRPRFDSDRAVAIACGLAPHLSEKSTATGIASDGDSYWATLAAIDEAIRNAVCVGANPARVAILDNFCWPKTDTPAQMGTLVRAAHACYDGALAYRTPFVSGKDSLNNQFTTEAGEVITIPQTMLVTALGIVDDARRARTMDAKAAGNVLLIVGTTDARLGGSHLVAAGLASGDADLSIPRVDLAVGPRHARAVAGLIADGLIASAHDCSDGGLLVAAAEMAFAGRVGLELDLAALPVAPGASPSLAAMCFAESPSRYLLEVAPAKLDRVLRALREANVAFAQVGSLNTTDRLTLRTPREGRQLDAGLDDLRNAWLRPLDW
jgi:phosphoribosylformylglycinamidine synthase II